MDFDTLARHHAVRARESVAGAVPPSLAGTVETRPPRRLVPKPVWAVLAAIAVLVVLGLPQFLGEQEQSPVTTPEEPGGFVPTGMLNSGCAWCEGILLEDGRVLVLGFQPEIYDPETGSFTTINLTDGLSQGSSPVLLGDGEVFATDGTSQWLFDPATSSFRRVGGVPAWEAATLGDGRVLLLGDAAESGTNETFLFDPDTDEISDGPATIHVYGNGAAVSVSLSDGRVLLLGSVGSEIFDPIAGSFTDAGERLDRGGFTATLLADGRVLIVGGQEEAEPYETVGDATVFDPATGEFTPTGQLGQDRFWHAASVLPDGRVLIVGGTPGDVSVGVDRAEIYDPSTGEFEPVAVPMTRERVAPGVVTLADGSVLIMGHYPGNGGGSSEGTSTAELFVTFGPVADDAVSAAENPTEVERWAEHHMSDLAPSQPSPLGLEARLVIPPGSLDGMTAVAVMASLDIVGEAPTGTVVASLGPPIDQELTMSETGGTGGGGEVSLPPECGAGCDLDIPVTVSWTGVDGPPPVVIGIRLQVAYQGRPPDAAQDLELTIAQP